MSWGVCLVPSNLTTRKPLIQSSGILSFLFEYKSQVQCIDKQVTGYVPGTQALLLCSHWVTQWVRSRSLTVARRALISRISLRVHVISHCDRGLCVLCVLCVVVSFSAIGGPRWRYITPNIRWSRKHDRRTKHDTGGLPPPGLPRSPGQEWSQTLPSEIRIHGWTVTAGCVAKINIPWPWPWPWRSRSRSQGERMSNAFCTDLHEGQTEDSLVPAWSHSLCQTSFKGSILGQNKRVCC